MMLSVAFSNRFENQINVTWLLVYASGDIPELAGWSSDRSVDCCFYCCAKHLVKRKKKKEKKEKKRKKKKLVYDSVS